MNKPALSKLVCILFVCVATAIASPAQILTTLHSFKGAPQGDYPNSALVRASNGNFYGTTLFGGNSDEGTIFEMTPSGETITLYSFCSQPNCSDGVEPLAVVQASDGNFYGTTFYGGTSDDGTVFQMTPSGALTTLHSFAGYSSDGSHPFAGLVQASDSNLYGTTWDGGSNNNNDVCVGITGGCGTIFKITSSGALTTLYNFCSQPNCGDGANPFVGLVQASDGSFYGTTGHGGANGVGTVFKMTPSGALTTLYSFCSQLNCSDGDFGNELVQGSDGNFYGTTTAGGDSNNCSDGCGTVFKITPSGALTTLHRFDGSDGAVPTAALVLARDGNFYGTTTDGGAYCPPDNGCGTVFKITPGGALTTLYSFTAGSDGYLPNGLVQSSDGNFYGTTAFGGAYGPGTAFRFVTLRACVFCPSAE